MRVSPSSINSYSHGVEALHVVLSSIHDSMSSLALANETRDQNVVRDSKKMHGSIFGPNIAFPATPTK